MKTVFKILFVGGYIAALPKKTLQDELSVDFVCTNEGVYTISNLLELKDFETSIFTGKYPTDIDDGYLQDLEEARSDIVKMSEQKEAT